MQTRLALHSEQDILEYFSAKKISAKLIKSAYRLCVHFELEIIEPNHPNRGAFVSPEDLWNSGNNHAIIHFDSDKQTMKLEL